MSFCFNPRSLMATSNRMLGLIIYASLKGCYYIHHVNKQKKLYYFQCCIDLSPYLYKIYNLNLIPIINIFSWRSV